MKEITDRLDNIEMYISNQEKMLDELNNELLRQAKIIDVLTSQNRLLIDVLKENPLKSESEETRPPHY